MEERRYDLSFMKEYAELYNLTDMDISNMLKIDGRVVIGYNAIGKYLSGEKKIRESVMEEILYELGYKTYEDFKNDILSKIKNKKLNTEINKNNNEKMQQILQEKKEKKQMKDLNKSFISELEEDNSVYNTFDFNKMNNKNIIIISILCDENLSKSIKEVATFLNISPEYVKNIYNEMLKNINNSIEQEKVKTK